MQFAYLFIAWQCGRKLTWNIGNVSDTVCNLITCLLLGSVAEGWPGREVSFWWCGRRPQPRSLGLHSCSPSSTAWAHQLPSQDTWMCCSHCFGCTTSERSIGYCALECLWESSQGTRCGQKHSTSVALVTGYNCAVSVLCSMWWQHVMRMCILCSLCILTCAFSSQQSWRFLTCDPTYMCMGLVAI